MFVIAVVGAVLFLIRRPDRLLGRSDDEKSNRRVRSGTPSPAEPMRGAPPRCDWPYSWRWPDSSPDALRLQRDPLDHPTITITGWWSTAAQGTAPSDGPTRHDTRAPEAPPSGPGRRARCRPSGCGCSAAPLRSVVVPGRRLRSRDGGTSWRRAAPPGERCSGAIRPRPAAVSADLVRQRQGTGRLSAGSVGDHSGGAPRDASTCPVRRAGPRRGTPARGVGHGGGVRPGTGLRGPALLRARIPNGQLSR